MELPQEIWTVRQLMEGVRDNSGLLMITGNARAARALRRRYDQWRHSSGDSGWPTPRIFGWETWLEGLWDPAVLNGVEGRVLLNPSQELELWRKVISNDEASKQIFSIARLAESAQRTWQQMQVYCIHINALLGETGIDTAAFARWTTAFESLCRQRGFLPSPRLEISAADWVPAIQSALPKEICLIGFDRIAPSQARLLQALQTHGCTIRELQLRESADETPEPAVVYAHTMDEEIGAAAHWARKLLTSDPGRRLGIVVPDLADVREAMDSIFRRILSPSSMEIETAAAALPYEFSLGTPMERLPDIRTALSLLAWTNAPLPLGEVSWLLVHGSFGAQLNDPDAILERAKLDRQWRDRPFQLGGPLHLGTFQQWLFQFGSAAEIKPLRRATQRLFAATRRSSLQRPRPFAEWREVFEELLATAEWHLLHPSSSREYQLNRRWNTVLDILSSLNTVSGQVTFVTAVEQLRHLAAQTLFSLESRGAPVQILGIAESAGVSFDAVWWMNARADTWPQSGNPQPFLPWHVQRQSAMPYANPAEDYAFARHVTERVLGCAGIAIVSFSLESSNTSNESSHCPDREAILSPMIRSLIPNASIRAVEEFVPEFSAGKMDGTIERFEIVDHESAVPLQTPRVAKGVRFLEAQAACPFRAFAELRLGSQPLAGFESGLSAKEKGIIAHRALQQFWDETKTQAKLFESTLDDLRARLRMCIANALRQFAPSATASWQRSLLEIESERLEARLLQWLDVEKLRLPFEVAATEDVLTNRELGGVEFDCRIDRIDKVSEGVVLIDYKTGRVKRNACTGERPDQPQLPAYTLLRTEAPDQPLAGVAFSGLHPQNVGFTVIASLPSIFESNSTTSNRPTEVRPPDEMLADWKITLSRLAGHFRSGDAIVDPKKGNETCKSCTLGMLCRIRETRVYASASSDAERESEDPDEDNS